MVIALAVACDDDFCVGYNTLSEFRVPSNLVTIKAFSRIRDGSRSRLYCMSPCPATAVEGAPPPGSTGLDYVLNGHAAFSVLLVTVATCPRWIDISSLYDDRGVPLAVAACGAFCSSR